MVSLVVAASGLIPGSLVATEDSKGVLEVVLEDTEGSLKEVKDGLLEEAAVMKEMDADLTDVVDIMDVNRYVYCNFKPFPLFLMKL